MSDKHIFAPNYTQVPNIIFDYWMKVLSSSEFVILLFICRKTFGWHETKETLSLKFISSQTGISKTVVIKCLCKLIEHGLIFKIMSTCPIYGNQANEYGIDVKVMSTLVQKKNKPDQNMDKGVCVESDQPLVSKPTKGSQENETDIHIYKETLTKRNTLVATDDEKKEKESTHTISAKSIRARKTDFYFSLDERKFIGISEEDKNAWKICYPDINLVKELTLCEQWLLANPKRMKKSFRRFVCNWLQNAQDKAVNRLIKQKSNESDRRTKNKNGTPIEVKLGW